MNVLAGAWVLFLLGAAGPAPAAPRVFFVTPDGASTGDGTQEKPLSRVDLAVGLARSGDTIRVAAGTYVLPASAVPVRLDVGNVRIEGGWDAAFTQRDPWGTPSVLQAPWDYASPLLELTPLATGAVLDGLVLDGGTGNRYGTRSFSTSTYDRTFPLIRIHQADGVQVRNCSLLNSPGHGLSASVRTSVLVVHNLVLSSRVSAVTAWGILDGATLQLRDNTLVDSWAERPDGAAGHAVDLQGGLVANLERNVVVGTQSSCIRVGMGNTEVVLNGNWLRGCGTGAVRAWVSAQGHKDFDLPALANVAAVSAKDNRLLAPDKGPATAVEAYVAASRTDGGAGDVPYAPREDMALLPWVNLVDQAGIRSGVK